MSFSWASFEFARCCSLEENDKIKQEINPRKINEPKTPYHGPMEEEPGCGKYAFQSLMSREVCMNASWSMFRFSWFTVGSAEHRSYAQTKLNQV